MKMSYIPSDSEYTFHNPLLFEWFDHTLSSLLSSRQCSGDKDTIDYILNKSLYIPPWR